MRTSTLVRLLENLDLKSRREARKWLASPMHNLRTDVAALFDYLSEGLSGKPELLNKQAAFTACYPNETYDDRRMNHLMSWLSTALRDYLAWREWQSDAAAVGLLRCRALRKLGLGPEFEKEWQQTLSALNAEPYRDEQYFYQLHLLQREHFEYTSVQKRSPGLSLAALAEAAETAHRLNRLRYECGAVVARAVSREADAPTAANPETDTIVLYEHLLEALRDPDREADFHTAKTLLETHWERFRSSERRDLYLLALNFCIRKINGGQREYMRTAFDLYRSGLENRALFEHGYLSRFAYKNAVTAGLNLREFEWVRAFIEDYRQHLPQRERHSAYSYNLAVWYFWQSDYDQTMTLLREREFGDPLTNLDARSILLRIYFERDYTEALASHLDSFQVYLSRSKNIGYQRDNYSNLLRIVRKMMRLDRKDSAARAALLAEVEQTQAIAEKRWLIEQLGR